MEFPELSPDAIRRLQGAGILPNPFGQRANPLLDGAVSSGVQEGRLPTGTAAPLPAAMSLSTPIGSPSALGSLPPGSPSPSLIVPSAATQRLPPPGDPIITNSQNALLGNQKKLAYLTNSGSGIDQITRPVDAQGNPTGQHVGPLRRIGGALARIGETAESVVAPWAAAATPGTQEHHNMLLHHQQDQVDDSLQNLQQGYQNQNWQAQAQHNQALATQEEAKAYDLLHPKPTPGALLYDKNGTPIGYRDGAGKYYGPDDPGLDAGVQHVLGAAQRKQPTNPFELWQSQNPKGTAEDYLKLTGEGKLKPLPEQYNEALASGDTETANRILKVIKDTQTQPKIDVHAAGERPPRQLAYVQQPDGSMKAIEVTPGTTLPAGASKTPDGKNKISADEQKRADLAQNLNENIDTLEDILKRRPELFGPIAGRWTHLRNLAGTDDADVSQLMTIEHQLGMVAQGAHGMRSAQGVESAARSLTNGFHNSPVATKAALESARKSVGTFLGNSQSPGQSRYEHIAVDAGGHEIGSNDGVTWYDTKTGKQVK